MRFIQQFYQGCLVKFALMGEFPREEDVSILSQILMVGVPEKYYLSQKACLGILRRADARGKELPELLKKALLRQASS